jgi:hypothetical protein
MLDMSSSVRTDRLFRIPEDKFNYKLGDLVEDDAGMVSGIFEEHKLTKAYKRKAYRRHIITIVSCSTASL